MLDRLPDDLLILIVECLDVIELIRTFRLINRHTAAITRLPVIWARLCSYYDIKLPSITAIKPGQEHRVVSIARLDDGLVASEHSFQSAITIPLDGEYPSSVLASSGGKHAVVACREGLAVVNVEDRTCRLLSIGPTGYDQPLCTTMRGSGDDEKLVVAYETSGKAGAHVCELLHIDVRSWSRSKRPLEPVTAMRFERPDKIAALTLAVPFLAIGWRSQVDLHDFVSHRMNTTIELPGKIRDMSFAETTLIVLHSDPPLITAFPLQYDAGGSMRPPKGITVDVPMSKHVGTTNKGVPLRFTTPSSNITCDDGAFVFLDGRGVLGDKFSRCIISLSWKHGQQDEISITCSPWSEPAIFDHTLFASSSKLRSRSTTTTSAVQAPSHQPTAGSIMNHSLQPSTTSPLPPLLPLSAKISASSICAGSHHIISCIMATHGQRAAPLVHTRMLADGSLVTKRLHLSEKTELLFGEDFSGASAPMAWDELSGRLFIVRSDWGDDWLVRDTLTVLQL